jgi:hypothetical protein
MHILKITYYYGLTLTNDRPVLSSERSPHIDRTANFHTEINMGLDTNTD